MIAAMGRAVAWVTAVDDSNGDDCALPSPVPRRGRRLGDGQTASNPMDRAERSWRRRSFWPLRSSVGFGRWCVLRSAPWPKPNANGGKATARLADAGVPGADPSQWHGMTALSTQGAVWEGEGHTAVLSPSTFADAD